jgi:hypothetical protein
MNRSRVERWSVVWLAVIGVCGSIQAGQTNSWSGPGSGNWEDLNWSLGVRPGAGQTIQLTNHGWKAVAIGPATAANFPDTMTIDALSVTSPGTDTVNTVLFNYAGFQTPFVTQGLTVSNGAKVVVLDSALTVQYGKLVVDAGSVTEDASSQISVAGLQLQNGGVYDLISGTFTVPPPREEDIVGGQFHQEGGSNFCYWLQDSGEYDFSGGDLVLADWEFPGTGLHIMGNFIQTGGTVSGQMNVGAAGQGGGLYALSNGMVFCSSLQLPWSTTGSTPDSSYFVQTGGTNFAGNVYIGTLSSRINNYPWFGRGYYTITNGLLVTTNIAINGCGVMTQSGGVHTNHSIALTQSDFFHQEQPGGNSYAYTEPGVYDFSGGTLVSDLVDMEPGGFVQSGGSAQITALQMVGGQYSFGGGQLTASNITLSGGANFIQTGGSITQTGTLSLNDSSLAAGSGPQIFGKLQLSTAGGTNSILTFPLGLCGLFFLNSGSLSWSNAAILIISNWNGALFGGGMHRIVFGSDRTGLTSQQLSQVYFSNPGGLPNGIYPARILPNGELVPDQNQGSESSGTVNSWISQTGGNWDDALSWSLGVPPGSSQSVMITNPYWKAVTIDSSTVSSAPQSLAVNSLTITSVSPTNGSYTTKNTLLLNYAGAGNPLVIGVDTNTPGSLLVDSNSTMAMFSSGLIVNNALVATNSRLGEFEVDGNFIQSDNSEVVAGFLDLNGTYNLTNGELFVGTQFINGAFNQQGGSTNTGSVLVTTNGNYQLFDGAVKGDIALNAGVFQQWGGTVSAQLTLRQPPAGGRYELMGGTLLPGNLDLGAAWTLELFDAGAGGIEQSGGTNKPGSLTIGVGYYSLSNGVLAASTMMLTTNTWVGGLRAGEFDQYGGYVTNGGLTMIGGTNEERGQIIHATANYTLFGGTLETPFITMNLGNFGLRNATNRVGTLSMDNSIYAMDSGLLVVDQLQLSNGSQFWHRGGAVAGIKNIALANGSWSEQTTGAQLGQLRLLSGTNSGAGFLSGPSVLQFADSSSVPWASDGLLTIFDWSGSLTGGGSQQILFGTSASGLTAQQLSQVQFRNPTGLPTGTYAARILSTGEVVPDPNSSSAGPVNSWINPTSGNWDDAASWSLGTLPNSSEFVIIANPGSKAVSINPATPVNSPGAMTVTNLTVRGATNMENTLLLNNFGTAIPLTVLDGLLLQDSAQILNFNSGLIVQGGMFMVTNSDLIQDGGFIRATNGPLYISGSEIDVTNGVFEGGSVSLGYPVSSHFNQYGGAVKIANLGFGSYVPGSIQNGYSLYGGTLDLPGGMFLLGERGGLSYFQAGGTNRTTQVTLEPDYGGWIGGFTLNGGLLADSGVIMMPGYETPISIEQNGGSHVITNSLLLVGGSTHGNSDPTVYHLNGGTLSAGMIELDADDGDTLLVQSNATTTAGTVYAHSFGYYLSFNTTITLAGGTLSCSNFTTADGGGSLNQTAGALIVSNLLDFGGSRDIGLFYIYGHYTFTGGTLMASNINMTGDWTIGDGTNRITNPGTVRLGHSTVVSNVVEQFGRFTLPTSTSIYLSGSAARLSFAKSSSESWASGATLEIFNWNGNVSGGGAEQVKFGTDQSGLTAAQLKQVNFRIGSDLYSAKILNTGEVVPDQVVAPPINYSQQGSQLILNWPPGYTLQTATQPNGPYSDVQSGIINATPPYTNNMTGDPQRFFRLRQ